MTWTAIVCNEGLSVLFIKNSNFYKSLLSETKPYPQSSTWSHLYIRQQVQIGTGGLGGGTDSSQTYFQKSGRGNIFKRAVVEIYNGLCVLSGMKLEFGVTGSMVDTCH